MSDWNDGPPAKFEVGMKITAWLRQDVDESAIVVNVYGNTVYVVFRNGLRVAMVQPSEVLTWCWPGPAQPERSESPWSRFLQSRMDCIAEWDRGGQSAVQILDTLTPDLGQIQLLISNARSKPMFTCRKPDEDGEPMSATNLARDDLRGQVLAYSRNETNYHRVADAMDTYAAAVRADERAKLEQAHKARLREEIEMAIRESFGIGNPNTLRVWIPDYIRSRGLEADEPRAVQGGHDRAEKRCDPAT